MTDDEKETATIIALGMALVVATWVPFILSALAGPQW